MLRTFWGLPLATIVAAGLAGAPASAQTGVDFYNGKTVTYIVATDPGGGYDTYGRLVAEFMQKHLPGSTSSCKHDRAGHIIGANAIYASEPDGLTIGTFNTGLIYNQLIGLETVKFDFTKMSWIGKAASEPRVIVVSKDSGIESFEQLKSLKEPVKFGTAGVGSASYVETTMLKSALGLPVDVITGYNGSDDQLAMRRGEIQGIVASRSTYEQFVKEGEDAHCPDGGRRPRGCLGAARHRSDRLAGDRADLSQSTISRPRRPSRFRPTASRRSAKLIGLHQRREFLARERSSCPSIRLSGTSSWPPYRCLAQSQKRRGSPQRAQEG